ncbi:MAG TPA: prepilin-type N-terminal cleavage/methylation domain-containing protein [Gemmatimonadaceae bacterium]
MRTHIRTRRGFSLVEIITALVILSILGVAMTKVMMSQTRSYQYDSGGRRSRTAARSAMNIMITDLRMTQDNGGIQYVDVTNNRRIDVRVPLAFGVVCSTTASSLIMAIPPVDSLQYQTMKFGGYGVRNATTGIYDYVPGGSISTVDRSNCHGGPKIYADTVPLSGRIGKVVQVTGALPSGTVAGSMAMIWQTVRYQFDSSKVYPNRAGLFRIVTGSASADTNELIAPFSWNARFKYYTSPMSRTSTVNGDTATATAPADLNKIRGFQIYLAAEAGDTVPGRNGPKKSPLTTAVFFKNTRTQ